jgi:hypothetical protein
MVLALLVGAGLPVLPLRAENFLWEPAIQVSATPDAGPCSFQELLLGRGAEFRLHAFVSHRVQRFSLRCCYLTVGRDLAWERAWREREEFTFETGTTQIAFVPVFLVDQKDRVHVIHEAFDTFRTATIHIGYKTNGWDHWNTMSPPALINSADIPYCMGANPGAGLSRDSTGVEWLHVLYHRRSRRGRPVSDECRPFWYVHNAKPLSVTPPEEGWMGDTWFTGLFEGQGYKLAGEGGVALSPVVDGRGRVHAIGRKKSVAADSIWVYHICGYPRAPGEEWDTMVAVIDSMPMNEPAPGEPVYWVTTQSCVGRSGSGECLNAVWSHNFREGEGIRKEVYFARFEVGADRWSLPLQLTPDGGVSSQGARLQRSSDGALHVMYHEHSPREPCVRLRYLTARGDPCVASHWTGSVPVTADVRTYANVPVFVAAAETVWVGYTSGDNDVTGVDGEPQAWFRKGYAIENRTSASTTWEGLVWLDCDYVVREGHALTVQPGTRVLIAGASLEDRDGFTPGSVDLIVDGEITAVGTPKDPIRFEVVAATGEERADWGGIHVREGAPAGRFENCDLGMFTSDFVVDSLPEGVDHGD